jgi:hypothetical protein
MEEGGASQLPRSFPAHTVHHPRFVWGSPLHPFQEHTFFRGRRPQEALTGARPTDRGSCSSTSATVNARLSIRPGGWCTPTADAEGWVLEKLRTVTAGAARLHPRHGGVEYLRGRFARGSPKSFHLVEPIGWLRVNNDGGGSHGDLSIFFPSDLMDASSKAKFLISHKKNCSWPQIFFQLFYWPLFNFFLISFPSVVEVKEQMPFLPLTPFLCSTFLLTIKLDNMSFSMYFGQYEYALLKILVTTIYIFHNNKTYYYF